VTVDLRITSEDLPIELPTREVEVASAQRFAAYDFVLHVPLSLEAATEQTETFLKDLRSFLTPMNVDIEGRVFRVGYYRWPLGDVEGQIVPNDGGGTDIMIHVREWEVFIACALVAFALGALVSQMWREGWEIVILPLVQAVLFYLAGTTRGPRFRDRIVRYFATPLTPP